MKDEKIIIIGRSSEIDESYPNRIYGAAKEIGGVAVITVDEVIEVLNDIERVVKDAMDSLEGDHYSDALDIVNYLWEML